MRDLLTELTRALEQRRECVYCSVLETRGSTPQKAGAAMLVFPDGGQVGTLGGGCIEAEVKQRALRVLAGASALPEVLTFCLDDNYGWDDGLICGGRMAILADPLTTSCGLGNGRGRRVLDYYRLFLQMVDQGHGCTEAVEMSGPSAGRRYLFDAAGQVVGQLADGTVPETIMSGLVPVAQRPRPYVAHGSAYLPILPRISIFLVGGGHVGQAVAHLAAEVDFDIWVLDDRDRYVSRERFPQASRLLVGDVGATLRELVRSDITSSTYCLIVTRGHNHDEEALYHLAESKAGYVGMIGSKRKIRLIYQDLLAKGVAPAALERVHAPLGFAIGSQTVPEIAVSIVAELIACRNLGATISAARAQVKV